MELMVLLLLVSEKLVVKAVPETVADTVYEPPVILAVKIPASAIPLASVITVIVFEWFENVPLAPPGGAVNVIEAADPLKRAGHHKSGVRGQVRDHGVEVRATRGGGGLGLVRVVESELGVGLQWVENGTEGSGQSG